MKLVLRKAEAQPIVANTGGIGRIMAIDPGLGGTGYAMWNRFDKAKLYPPLESGSIAARKDGDQWSRIDGVCIALRMLAQQHLVHEVVIEQPQFFEGGKGIVAARDGDLVILSIMVGAIMGRLCDGSTIGHLVPVNVWKGQLKKEECERRIRARLQGWSPKTTTSHEIDAVGIGLWAKGHF